MTEKDLQFVNLPPDQMAPPLANGNVDAACVLQSQAEVEAELHRHDASARLQEGS
jgi:ABC-type nitrate/sulfonate/bicarbonate transport system substrate-binding protein